MASVVPKTRQPEVKAKMDAMRLLAKPAREAARKAAATLKRSKKRTCSAFSEADWDGTLVLPTCGGALAYMPRAFLTVPLWCY